MENEDRSLRKLFMKSLLMSKRCWANASIKVSDLLKLGRGAVVRLDRRVGETVEVYVNSKLIGRGDLIVIDGRLGVTMTEIFKSSRKISRVGLIQIQ